MIVVEVAKYSNKSNLLMACHKLSFTFNYILNNLNHKVSGRQRVHFQTLASHALKQRHSNNHTLTLIQLVRVA